MMSSFNFLDQLRKRKIAQARAEISRRKHWLIADLKKYGFQPEDIKLHMAAIEDTRRSEPQAAYYLDTEVLSKLEQDIPKRLLWDMKRHARAINAAHHTIQKLQSRYY